MTNMRTYTAWSIITSFFAKHKKVVICTILMFVSGIVIGVLTTIKGVNGDFEKVARADMIFGGTKVFFLSALALVGGYIAIFLAGHSNKTVFLIAVPFVALGFVCGQYSCALIGKYESMGIVNLCFVYLPVFLLSFVCMMICAVGVLSSSCVVGDRFCYFKASFIVTLKMIGINLALNFLFFMLIGSIFGVLIVKIY